MRSLALGSQILVPRSGDPEDKEVLGREQEEGGVEEGEDGKKQQLFVWSDAILKGEKTRTNVTNKFEHCIDAVRWRSLYSSRHK